MANLPYRPPSIPTPMQHAGQCQNHSAPGRDQSAWDCSPRGILTSKDPVLICENGTIIGLAAHRLHLFGEIPESIGSVSSLVYVNLGPNQFHGTIPDSLGRLERLEYLYLDHNRLQGQMPHSLFGSSTLYWSWTWYLSRSDVRSSSSRPANELSSPSTSPSFSGL